MIHVDVRIDSDDATLPNANLFPKILVQTSIDGGPWATQYVFYASAVEVNKHGVDEARELQRLRAEDAARVFVNGCRFAGAEVRATSFGYAL